MKQFIIGFLLVTLFSKCGSTQEAPKLQKKRPNVIIILSDDQGWADVGFNGCTDIPTPNLDALAASGVVFSQGYASHPYCSPSRAGLLTGRYQQRFGHENNMPYENATANDGLPVEEYLISEVLNENNYHTSAIGKWHLGDSARFWPVNQGFDDWFGFFGGSMSYWGEPKHGNPMDGVLRNGKPVALSEITYLTDDFTKEAVNKIDDYSKDDNPFFMYLAYNAPHSPLHATSDYLKVMDHQEDGQRAAYGAMVYAMDKGIGEVIQKLKETGQYENTLIFFYSDNGGALNGANNQPFRGHKGMLFEGGIRVPFCVSWPAALNGGSTYSEPISALDIFPTILEATGVSHPKPESLDGVDLMPFLSRNQTKAIPHDVLFWRYSDGVGYAVRKGNYKMVRSGYKEKILLFDIASDPYENRDLADNMPEKVAELQALYDTWNEGTVPAKWYDPHGENVLKEEKKRQYFIEQAKKGERKINL